MYLRKLHSLTAMMDVIAPDLIIGLLGIPVGFAFQGFGDSVLAPGNSLTWFQQILVLVACFGNLAIAFVLYAFVFIGQIRTYSSLNPHKLFLSMAGLLTVTLLISLTATYASSCFKQAVGFMGFSQAIVILSVAFSPWYLGRFEEKSLLRRLLILSVAGLGILTGTVLLPGLYSG